MTRTYLKKWNKHACGFDAKHSTGQCFRKGIDLEERIDLEHDNYFAHFAIQYKMSKNDIKIRISMTKLIFLIA